MKLSTLLLPLLPFAAFADTLELKNGTLLNGTFMGGTAGSIRFETAQGLQVIPKADALALTFTAAPTAPAVTPGVEPPAATPPPATVTPTPAASGPVSVPVGTRLTVKLDDAVNSATAAGRKFGATLVSDLVVNGVVAVKAGTGLIGEARQVKQGGRLAGKSSLVITLTSINLGGALVPIMTSDYGEEGANALKNTARTAAVGALIGEATNNDAGGGAAIGVGVAALTNRGGSINLPAGTTLEFELNAPIDVPAGGTVTPAPAGVTPPVAPAPVNPVPPPVEPPRRGLRR